MENSINRFDVYNSAFLEFRFLYYLMSWLAADQFLLDDIVRVICDAEQKKAIVKTINRLQHRLDLYGDGRH